MILKATVNVRERPWPSGGETKLQLELEKDIADAVIEVLRARDASLKSLEFTLGRS